MNRSFSAAVLALYFSLSAMLVVAAEPAAPSPKAATVAPKPLYAVSKETTYLTAPLRADGSVDYIAALDEELSRGVTPENNAAVLLWKVLGPKEINEKVRDQYFQKLGIAPLPETGDYLVELSEYVKAQGIALPRGDDEELSDQERLWKQFDAAMTRPWSKQEFPAIAMWLAASEKPLALAIEATKRPRRYDPLLGDDESMLIDVLLPGINEHRRIAKTLVARAMLRAEAGEISAAWDDLLACHRLGRLSAQGATLVDGLVGIAIDSIACAGDRALLQHVPLTAQQAAAMRADLAKLPALRGMDVKLDRGERFMFLDGTATLARKGLAQIRTLLNSLIAVSDGPGVAGGGSARSHAALASFLDALGAVAMDWDGVMRNGNRWYDRLVAAARQPTIAQRKAALKQFDEELKKLAGAARNTNLLSLELLGDPRAAVTRRIGDILIALLMPALTTVMNAEDRAVMQSELLQVGFALAAYRAERGKYPAALEDLAPAYLAAVPSDLFVDAKLRYRAEDGGYLLYSVGPNGSDDGGRTRDDATNSEPWDEPWDDLVVRVTPKAK